MIMNGQLVYMNIMYNANIKCSIIFAVPLHTYIYILLYMLGLIFLPTLVSLYLSISTTILLGITGDSNTNCYNATAIKVTSGGACLSNSDCQYDSCIIGVCVAPALACPSNQTGEILYFVYPYTIHF
jgi:hypothetical protein